MNKEAIKKAIKADDLTTAIADIGGEEYKMFIQCCSDGLYSVDFGGRLGDIEAVVNLLARMNIKEIFY